MGIGKKAGFLLMMAVTACVLTVPSYAASRKKITSVRVKVTARIQPDTRFGEEDVEVDVGNGKYTYDYYEINNDGFGWTENDVPDLTIYLNADEGYYFSMTKASAVDLTGATYVKATRKNSSEVLALQVKLPSLGEQVSDLEEVVITSSGYVYWNEVTGAGSYELRVYRNGNLCGTMDFRTTDTVYNLQNVMTRSGTYQAKVRPCNKVRPENKGDWVESGLIRISAEEANAIREGMELELPLKGEWKYDADNGWWYQYEDGTYAADSWQQIDGHWYCFDERGYLRTGWIEWEGKEYYCKEGTGEMLTNTMTPDGYLLDGNGTKRTD